jgi:MFS family permease
LIRNIKIITAASFMAMFFLGVGGALIGSAARDIGLTAAQIGVLIAVQNLGFMLSVGVAGALADARPKPKLLLAGSLVLAFAFLTFPWRLRPPNAARSVDRSRNLATIQW